MCCFTNQYIYLIIQMHRQSSLEAILSNTNNSKSTLTFKNYLAQQITAFSKHQHTTLNDLSQKCSIMEFSLGSIEVIVAKLSQRLRYQAEKRQSEVLSNLKIKQYEFIINQLKTTIIKNSKKQQKNMQYIDTQKRKEQQLRSQLFNLQDKYNLLQEKYREMEISITEKNEELQQLTLANHKYKLQLEAEDLLRNRYKADQQNEANSKECYLQLQNKLEQLQKDMQTQITILQVKNKELNIEIKKLQNINDEALGQNRNHKRHIDQINRNKYELQIKLKQQISMNQQLEQNYNKLLEKSSSLEIALHKQIQQLKFKQIEIKNQIKKEKKTIKSMLCGVAQIINNGLKYYLASNSIKEQIQQIKKLYQKVMKKKTQQFSKEIESYELEVKKLKAKNESTQQSLLELQRKDRVNSGKRIQYLSQREFEKLQPERLENENEGTNSFVNKSIEKSQEDRYKNIEQKYKTKLQSLRKDLKNKQNRINQLQNQLQIEFDNSKQKILELQTLVSEKANQIRKSQMKLKEKDYELQEMRNFTKQLETKNAFLAQKFENQKQMNLKISETKTQNYEQKLKKLKANNKELQKKQQQKTIKYNKLKSKYQKYQIEVTESLKRKNSQIEQMLRQNARVKTEYKLLQEKTNLRLQGQAAVKNISKENTNKNTLQEFQFVKQKMIQEISEKEKRIAQLIQSITKMSGQLFSLKREINDRKNTIDQQNKDNKILRQDNINLKEKLQLIIQKNNQQSQQKHSYLRKQLQKALIQSKKLQKNTQRYTVQKQNLKKYIQQLQTKISNLSLFNQKLKQRNTSLSFEFQHFKQEQKKKMSDYQIKLSEFATKQQQLVDIINYKNRQSSSIRDSMKGDEIQGQLNNIIKFDKSTYTEGLITFRQSQMNTQKIEEVTHEVRVQQQKHVIPSEILFDNQYEQPIQTEKKQVQVNQNSKVIQQVNYFNDLITESQNLDEHFDICEEGQEINIGQTALNIQIKEVFNSLRKQIQKIFNQEDISIQMMKELPKHLEDDFNDFMAYIKEKIFEIKRQNNLSFIMVEQGSEIEIIQQEIANFIKKQPLEQYIKLQKIIEQKEIMITSLMNEKTEQQNTINQMTLQKEQMDQQNQNRFMNQCNVYKKQIKECKKIIDILEMNCQSLKNIFKNTIELWVEDNDNQDDIKDNIVLYINICKLNQTDKRKLNQCLQKYRYSKMRK